MIPNLNEIIEQDKEYLNVACQRAGTELGGINNRLVVEVTESGKYRRYKMSGEQNIPMLMEAFENGGETYYKDGLGVLIELPSKNL